MTNLDPETILKNSRYVFFSFNGPICNLFTEQYPVTIATDRMRQVLTDHGVKLPPEVHAETEPLNILRYAATLNKITLLCEVEDALCTAELSAVATATPTTAARRAIIATHWSGRPIAIVSNVSANAIGAYLIGKRIYNFVHPVVGRGYGHPEILKPHPSPIIWAMHQCRARPEECVLITSSPADIPAARAARVAVILHADGPEPNPPHNADIPVATMADIAAITTRHPRFQVPRRVVTKLAPANDEQPAR